jgi:hypothetical protein
LCTLTQTIEKTSSCKIVVFVPVADLPKVSNALFHSGAGVIGQYQHCSFRVAGTGTFLGTGSANPTVGKVGKLEQVDEYRLEVVCPSDRVADAIAAMRQSHSYEEPPFDVYPLQSTAGALPGAYGSGRIGILPRPLSPSEWAAIVAELLQTPIVLTGQRDRTSLSTVAIVCGAGGSLMKQAIAAGADAFLTGEIRFHDELAAQAADVTVIAAGHYATERPGVEHLAQRLADVLTTCKVWASCAEQNPAQWVTFTPKPSSG